MTGPRPDKDNEKRRKNFARDTPFVNACQFRRVRETHQNPTPVGSSKMKTTLSAVALVLLFALPAFAAEEASFVKPLAGFFQQHCYDCHGNGTAEGGLDLTSLGQDLSDAELMRRWTLVHDRVAIGEMPPKDQPRPAADAAKQFLGGLGKTLHEADAAQRQVVLRRLNRVEFENTLRDLFELPHIEVKDMLPEDAKAHGFDTIGSALALSTEQMLVYLEAVDHVLDAALAQTDRPQTRISKSDLKTSSARVLGRLFRSHPDGVVMFSSSYSPSAFRGFSIREPGIYRFKIQARAFQSEKPMTLRVYAGDVIANRRDRWLAGYFEVAPGDAWTTIEFEERLERNDSIKVMTYRNGGHLQDAPTTKRPGIMVGEAICEGPMIETWPPPSRVKLLGDVDPASATEADAIAILKRFLPFVYRRKVEPQELEPYAALTRQALADGRPWTEALRQGLKAMLVSPQFLFLEEPGRDQVSDYALACRLSYFLWKSIPDAELLSLAYRGRLNQPNVLREQVERLLGDPRSGRFVEDFTGQWLDLHDIDFTEPDRNLYPEYDDVLRSAMLAESRRFFSEVLEKDLAVGQFVDADWTILNSRLAEHYGIEGVDGLHYRRVALPADSPRGGVFTQAAVLKVTANGTNTSPVIRGAWMLENILGQPVPPPPANVPAVEPDISGATTLRQQLDKHRDVATCASCHKKIDPPGFALERFDPVGGWRDWYRSTTQGERINDKFIDAPINRVRVRYRKGLDVDASGALPEGQKFADFPQFKAHLAKNPSRIARTLAEKLLEYSLGRGLGFSDRPALEEIVDQAAEDEYGFRSLIHRVVQSPTFRKP